MFDIPEGTLPLELNLFQRNVLHNALAFYMSEGLRVLINPDTPDEVRPDIVKTLDIAREIHTILHAVEDAAAAAADLDDYYPDEWD